MIQKLDNKEVSYNCTTMCATQSLLSKESSEREQKKKVANKEL